MKKMFGMIAMFAVATAGALTPVVVRADDAIGNVCDAPAGTYDEELLQVAGCKLDENDVAMPVVIDLIRVALSVIGILAVGVIVLGGITYITSTGDAVKTQRAKNTILYGVVGLIVALMAFTIVHFISISIWG